MSVTDRTEVASPEVGRPTAWSTTVDALAYGHDVAVSNEGDVTLLTPNRPGPGRLFFISAGNVREEYDQDHLSRCDLTPVEDLAQSWNAVTVGVRGRAPGWGLGAWPPEGTRHTMGRAHSASTRRQRVELRGIEPLTYSMRTSRATNCATAPMSGVAAGHERP